MQEFNKQLLLLINTGRNLISYNYDKWQNLS